MRGNSIFILSRVIASTHMSWGDFWFGESCTFYLQRRKIWPLSRIASPYKVVVGADCPTTIGGLGEGGECISRDRCFLSQRVRGESEECRTNLCRNRVFCSPLCSIVGVRRLQSRESLWGVREWDTFLSKCRAAATNDSFVDHRHAGVRCPLMLGNAPRGCGDWT